MWRDAGRQQMAAESAEAADKTVKTVNIEAQLAFHFVNVKICCTDLSGKEPHRQAGIGSDIRGPMWCNG